MSEVIKGIGNNSLYAIGRLHFYNSRPKNVNAYSAGSTLDINLELARLELAFGRAKEELEEYGSAEKEKLRILNQNEGLWSLARERIFRGQSAFCAIKSASEELALEESQGEDPYLIANAAAIADIGSFLASIIKQTDSDPAPKLKKYQSHPVLLIADGLTENELMKIDREMLLGIIIINSSPLSPISLSAYSLAVPTLIVENGAPIRKNAAELEGKTAIIDCEKGILLIDPDEMDIECSAIRLAEIAQQEAPIRGAHNIPYSAVCPEIHFSDQNNPPDYTPFSELLCYLDSLSTFPVLPHSGTKIKNICFVLSKKNDIPKDLLTTDEHINISIAFSDISSAMEMRSALSQVNELKNELDPTMHSLYSGIQCGAMLANPAAVIMREEIFQLCDFAIVDSDRLFISLFGADAVSFTAHDISKRIDVLQNALDLLCCTAKENGKSIAIRGMLASQKRFCSYIRQCGIDKIYLPSAYLTQI